MAVPKVELTLAEFQEGYAEGYVLDVVVLKVGAEWRIYGKDSRGMADTSFRFRVVWARMP